MAVRLFGLSMNFLLCDIVGMPHSFIKTKKGGLKFPGYWKKILLGLCGVVTLVEAVLWAHKTDSFVRRDIVFQGAHSGVLHCPMVCPRSKLSFPLLLLLDGTGRSCLENGPVMRSMAQTGFSCAYLATVRKSAGELHEQITALLDQLASQRPVGRRFVIIGNGTGMDILLDAASSHNRIKPDLVYCVSENGELDQPGNGIENRSACPIIVITKRPEIHGCIGRTNSWWTALRSAGGRVEFATFENANDFPDREILLLKEISEQALTRLLKSGKPMNAPALSRRQAGPGWLYWGPPVFLFLALFGMVIWGKATPNTSLAWEWAKWGTAACSVLLGAVTCVIALKRAGGTAPTSLFPDEPGPAMADVVQAWRLTAAKDSQIQAYISLAGYNRALVNWTLDQKTYDEYVLNPCLASGTPSDLSWRQLLWKFFFPVIRKASSPSEAASILVQKLREEIEIRDIPPAGMDNIMNIWNQRQADPAGFEAVYIAALRSVGVAARLDAKGYAEIWDGGGWKPAARPGVIVAL